MTGRGQRRHPARAATRGPYWWTTNPAAPVEALSWEVRAATLSVRPAWVELSISATSASETARRCVYFRGGWQDIPIFDRDALPAQSEIHGPAVIEASDTTILVNPGHAARMDRFGNLIMDVH